MKYARIVNSCAVDTRTDSPEGCFTDNIVAEFSQVPDDVADGWIIADGSWSAPVVHIPTDEEIAAAAAAAEAAALVALKDSQRAAIQVQIDAIESATHLNRGSRELEIVDMEDLAARKAPTLASEYPELTVEQIAAKILEGRPYYGKLLALDAQVGALRAARDAI